MQQTLLAIAEYALPPTLGAMIGYLTNYVAIRMLFRPLRAYRVAGVRIPFTPGIIPKQREDLAQSIARMVSTQLLTEDAVRSHLRSPQFQEGIRTGISNLVDEIGVRTRRSGLNQQSVQLLEELAGNVVSGLVESPRVRASVGSAVEQFLLDVADRKVGDLVPNQEAAEERLEQLVDRALDREELREGIVDVGMEWLDRQLRRNTPLSEIVPENAVGEVARLLVGVYDPALTYLMEWLRRRDIRTEIEIRGKVILRDILDKLNVWQRFFVTATQYDRQLAEKMPEIVTDLLDTLEETGRSQKNKERAIDAVLSAVRRFRNQGIADAAYAANIDVHYRGRQLLGRAAAMLTGPGVREQLKEQLARAFRASEHRTVGQISEEWLKLPREDLARRGREWVIARLDQPQTVERIQTAAQSTVRSLLTGDRTGGQEEQEQDTARQDATAAAGAGGAQELLGLTGERKKRLVDVAAQQFDEVVDARLPQIVAAMDVHTLVVNKIDSLDVSHVERLLLGVIARHLKWINLFGALLGAIIGGSQVLGAAFLWG
jgi:uncharacterized membrane protein YheB (UPF0754 family)